MHDVVVKLSLCGIILIHMQLLLAQDMPVDSSHAENGNYEAKDTLIESPVKLPRKWYLLQQMSIDSLLSRQQNTRFGKGLYQLLIRDHQEDLIKRKTPTSNSELAAKDGKIIRKIEFRSMDVFAPKVTDTAYTSPTGLERTLNALHTNTRQSLLARHLLFKPGEPLDVFLVAENERILRDLSFIDDAKFLAKSVPGSPDSVDLLLITQDLFPVGFNAQISSSKAGSASLWNHNLFGYGIQPMITLFWDGNQKHGIGYGLTLGTANLDRNFTTAKLEYINRWSLNSILLDISRDFKTSSFVYAGGAMIEHTSSVKDIDLLDTLFSEVNLKYTNIDLWAGRMIRLRNHSPQINSGLYVTGRVNFYEKHEGPETSENYLQQFQDRTLYLLSFCFAEQGFKKDNLIYTFGRTEDVPFGHRLELSAGFEQGQYDLRYYISAGASAGKYFNRAGYFYALVNYGTFLNHSKAEQGALQIRVQRFSRLYRYHRYQFRNFVNVNYVDGMNRFEGEFVSLENRGGIPGLRSSTMRGIDKLTLGLESVVFSPFKFLGFRFAFFGSVDLGLISLDHDIFKDSNLYSGLSVGVRIRNDQLVFNTFEISFSVYPGMPAGARGKYFTAGSLARMRFDDFFPNKPDIIKYQ